MKKADMFIGRFITGFAAICLSGAISALPAVAAPDIAQGFDAGGEKIFKRYSETPLSAMTGIDGTRTLNSFYELRQYPGSPPRIPHKIPSSFAGESFECIACHGRGGYVAEFGAYAPVTPHPENTACLQCHVPRLVEELFVETGWKSINPPVIGRPQLGGSPPPVPHSLQLREDCIACHTGNAAVAEIRVEHGSRGNCRQCHVPMAPTRPVKGFARPR